jgi:hypothetical protein
MDLNGIGMGAIAPVQEDTEKQAEHTASPVTEVAESPKTIVLALAGFMIIFYMLHVAERWAVRL